MSETLNYSLRPIILIVDDTPENITLINGLLKDIYRTRVAISGERALKAAVQEPRPDLILLDIMMPDLSGYEVAEQLKRDPRTAHIPIIFITAMATMEDEILGLQMGAVDYITKPINPPIVLARVETQLKIKAAADFLRDQKAYLEQEVQRRTAEVIAIQDVTIQAMTSLAETRDNETGNHIRRTQHYVRLLAEMLREHPRFQQFLNDESIRLLFKSAPLHDIGKIGIPDDILLKPGRLTPEEFETMKTHTVLGRDAIRHAEEQLGTSVGFLRLAKEIAYSHHEKWDGSGYPQGLAGEDIPIEARVVTVADVFDALISPRPYKEAWSIERALEYIEGQSGKMLDPTCVRGLLDNVPRLLEICDRYSQVVPQPDLH